jgi:hypothetical protein
MRRLVVLYEDARGPVQRFPLHDLVVKSAADLLSSVGPRLDPALLAKAQAKRLDARDILLDDIGRSRQHREALRASHAGFDCVSRFVGCVAAMQPWPPR